MKEKENKIAFQHRNPILTILMKLTFIAFVIGYGLYYSEEEGFFEADKTNNHTLKKWDAYYKFSKKNKTDILLVGNSHLYTGINPKNLSAKLGVNAFILASPGTNVADAYFSIKEAIKVRKPKLIVLETYCINAFSPYELKGSALSDQLKSFSARRDLTTKIESTPKLFATDNYPYAWSNTFRNHSFLYQNKKQIETNLNPTKKKTKKLYLGRYVRFQKGLKDSLINLYDSLGAPVNGSEYETNLYAANYTEAIENLCKEEGIKLVYLTLPMHEKHVTNYPVWQSKLDSILSNDIAWLDLQDTANYPGFTVHSFENTYKENQHMTYSGSLIATYKLADFIEGIPDLELPNRKSEIKWKKLFKGEEGFYENVSPDPDDKSAIVLFSSGKDTANSNPIIEIIQIKKGKKNSLIVKIDPTKYKSKDFSKEALAMSFIFSTDGSPQKRSNIVLNYDAFHSNETQVNFIQNLIPLTIHKLVKIGFKPKEK